jgi:AcrR family transcriptional regulator
MATLDTRSEATRRRLVEAGLELFGRQGYEAVTTRALAEAAGVNQAAIPYHFGGKEGVYRAVAEHVAAVAGARIRPLVASVRERLAENPDRPALAALLLTTTQALAQAIFEPVHRGVWSLFLVREQFNPSAAFEHLYGEFGQPAHALVGELVGCLTGRPAEAAETILLAHAYLGQIIGFASARATLNRRLGRDGDFSEAEVAALLAAIEALSRATIRGLAGVS